VRQPVEIFRANAHLQARFSASWRRSRSLLLLHPHRLGDDAPDRQRGSSEESGS
jgi:hypothetical protein